MRDPQSPKRSADDKVEPHRPSFRPSAALVLVVASIQVGCFSDDVVAGARITCESSGDCPTGYRCPALIGLCLLDDDDDTAPDATTTLSADLLPAAGTLRISLTPNEALAGPPIVRVGDIERSATASDADFVVEMAATELGGGIHAAVAVLVDDSGNVGLVIIGAVVVDDVLPTLDAATPIRLTLTAPPGVIVAAPRQVVPRTRARLVFDASEPLGAVPVVVARLDGATGPVLPFAFVGEVDGAFVFEAVAGDDLEAGVYGVVADLVDIAGNLAQVEVPLPDPGIVVADIIDSPCVAVDDVGVAICTDFDGDGVVGRSADCPSAPGFDCDDSDPLVAPGAIEIPGDQRDNDCAGDGDAALDETTAVFADPAAAAGGDGTRGSPFSDLFTATDAARDEEKWLALRAGSFDLEPDGWFTSTGVLGGLDDQWQLDPALRTRVEFNTARDTVFPVDAPQLYIGLDLVSENSLIDAVVPLTVVRSSLAAVESVASAPFLRLVGVELSGGFIQAQRLEVLQSRVGADVGMQEGLLLRARMENQINVGSGRVVVVSSSILSVGFDRGFAVNGTLKVFGSTVRVLGDSPGDESGPVVNLNAGSVSFVGSVLQATTLVQLGAGDLSVVGSAVVTSCAVRDGASDCLLPPSAENCGGVLACTWSDILVLADVAVAADDPHRLVDPALAAAGPSLSSLGAPTSSAGDLFGACRNTGRPALGANEP